MLWYAYNIIEWFADDDMIISFRISRIHVTDALDPADSTQFITLSSMFELQLAFSSFIDWYLLFESCVIFNFIVISLNVL